MKSAYVIGSGPNGLTAAIILARAGWETTVLEAQSTLGGGTRTAELTLPGFRHDVCSAVHPMALSSPAFQSFPLGDYGLQWIQPEAPLAHALFDGTAIMLEKSVAKTAALLGKDGALYQRMVGPLAARWSELAPEILAPLHFPRHPFLLARFGLLAAWPAALTARTLFRTPQAQALLAGAAGHSFLPMETIGSAAIAWPLLLAAHAVGWPIARGGSQSIADALSSYFQSLGGRVVLNQEVRDLGELKDADLILADVTPRQVLKMGSNKLPDAYCRALESYRYGPGVFKLDWALSGPIPWTSKDCARAATVHIGGTLEDISESERAPWENRTAERPFVLLAQPSLFDSTRAPAGKQTAWAYCHVPNGSTTDMTSRVESQIERAAPGFSARILARHAMTTAYMEQHNANLVGGDINGGAFTLKQIFLRPTRHLYRTPFSKLYLCSASTPPGGGVHGMCGYNAARTALLDSGSSL